MTELQQISNKIAEADAILIGASNGLSITEGLHLFADNQAFNELFGDLKRRYGIRSILQGAMGRWPSEEERWGFWSRLIKHYCIDYKENQVMSDLKAIVGEKDYFVVTSNGERHFEMCGFDEEKVYEVEGDWLHMQCSHACHDTVYPSVDLVSKMADAEKDGRIPSELVPHCSKCGAPMMPYLQVDRNFIPNREGYARYQAFLEKYHGKKIVILELGIGARNQLIKAPLMRLTAAEPNATYVTINLGEVYITENIEEKSFGLDGYLSDILGELRSICCTE